MKAPATNRRRLALAMLLTFLIVAGFVVRLVDIQVVQADQLNKDSFDKRAIAVTNYAARGSIVDDKGTVLAASVMRYDITASPRNVRAFERTVKGKKVAVSVLEAAGELAKATGQDQNTVYQALTKDPKSDFAYVAKGVDTATLRAVRKLSIPGIWDQKHPARTYPDGAVAGNLVGFVGTDGPQVGLEKTENKCLASTNGSSTYERGADGVPIPGSTVTSKAAVDGGTLKLTIDSDLQWFVQQAIAEQATAIGAKSATAVVLRVNDAHIMALADWPSVDPNDVGATPVANYGSLAFRAYYEPGSTMKALSASMLIDSGIATPTSQVTVPAVWKTPDGSTIYDAGLHATEHLTLTGVLQQSSNVGISMLGINVPPKVRYNYMEKFGLGQETAVGFQGEQARGIPPLKDWNNQRRYDMLYGQGVAVTALQLAGAYQAIANGGVRLPLTLVEGCTEPDGTVTDLPPTTGVRVISDASSKTVVNMLESVVTGGELGPVLRIPGYRVAAKSGTAQVALPNGGGYGSDRIVSLAGIAPAEDPQYVVLVTYTKPAIMKSSAAAAPTFHKIMTQVLKTYRVPPSTTPSTSPPATW
ncbi:peptidoglycan D,D-transpeptidase FtsI family protein [Parafrigoribacterium humi]|uniref:peptidoglycan D,D-transpeptidase FtsI family protein n=1 Tax=Parafrigoribacterium humi TaxID=3144664 RepID=UPI0032EF4027